MTTRWVRHRSLGGRTSFQPDQHTGCICLRLPAKHQANLGFAFLPIKVNRLQPAPFSISRGRDEVGARCDGPSSVCHLLQTHCADPTACTAQTDCALHRKALVLERRRFTSWCVVDLGFFLLQSIRSNYLLIASKKESFLFSPADAPLHL